MLAQDVSNADLTRPIEGPPRATLERLAERLTASRRTLPTVTRAALEREGILTRHGPRTFRRNFGRTYTLRPSWWARPRSPSELWQVIGFAYQQGLPIKAIGSLCTWSEAARPERQGIALLTDRLAGVVDPDWSVLRWSPSPGPVEADPPLENRQLLASRHLIRVLAGTTIWALNEELDRRGLGLKTMGAYGGERVGGAFSTGTHGSSRFMGPMCDAVRSMDLVWQGVPARLEPSDGPTDPARFATKPAHRHWVLLQDDEVFDAVRLSYGMLGVVWSYLIEVGTRHYFEERREQIGLDRAREEIRAVVRDAPGNVFERAYSAEYYFNLYADTTAPRAIRVSRRLTDATRLETRRRTFDEYLFRGLRRVGIDPGRLSTALFRAVPRLVPRLLEAGLAGIAGRFRGVSHRVYNMGAANLVGTLVQEIGVPAGSIDAYLDECAVLARELFRRQARALTAPIGVRFVRSSSALLAVQQRTVGGFGEGSRPVELWAMVNFTLTIGTPRGSELMAAFHALARRFGGRAHPGKCHFDDTDRLRDCYRTDRLHALRKVVDPEGLLLNRWNRALLGLSSAARPSSDG